MTTVQQSSTVFKPRYDMIENKGDKCLKNLSIAKYIIPEISSTIGKERGWLNSLQIPTGSVESVEVLE